MDVRVRRARGYVEVADCRDAVEAVLEGCEGGGLWEEHEEAVEAFVEVGIALGFEELHAEIWSLLVQVEGRQGVGRLTCEDRGFE